MERLSGVPLTDLASIRAVTSKDPEGVLISALNTWFASVLGADTFHADVHAGWFNSCFCNVQCHVQRRAV
jgi:aarF domain-containing kinase